MKQRTASYSKTNSSKHIYDKQHSPPPELLWMIQVLDIVCVCVCVCVRERERERERESLQEHAQLTCVKRTNK
jgi:hypothetical protein